MLSALGISKTYGSLQALDSVDIEVASREIVALVGPNGAGKSTLARIITGLAAPDTGTVTINGFDLRTDRRKALSYVGYAAQEVSVYPARTVEGNLQNFGRLGGISGRDLERRINEYTAQLGLHELRQRHVFRLSGGEKRRLHVAIALLTEAPFIMLDEPTANADIDTRRDLLNVVRDLAASGTGILYASHYLPEVEELKARVVMIDHGRVITTGSIEDLVARFGVTSITARFTRIPDVTIGIPNVHSAIHGTTLEVTLADDPSVIKEVLGQINESDCTVENIDIVKPGLESVYLNLRGIRLSEDGGGDKREGEED